LQGFEFFVVKAQITYRKTERHIHPCLFLRNVESERWNIH